MRSGPALVVCSRAQAEAYVPAPGETVVCISITDPGAELAVLSPGFADVLRLAFSDLDLEMTKLPPGITPERAREIVGCMGPADAGAIVRFVVAHRDADVLVIHCEMGISRSRSIAEALFDAFGRRVPNQQVYGEVVAAFRRQPFDVEARRIAFRWAETP